MTEVPPILTDKAAETAFLINSNIRAAEFCLAAAEICAKQSVGRRGLAAFICRMRARAWIVRWSRHQGRAEATRLGL